MKAYDEPTPTLAAELADEQAIYAKLVERWTHACTALLLAIFAIYVFEWRDPHVPLARLPQLWGEPVHRFLALSGAKAGWDAIDLIGRSDVMNLVGIGLLSSAPALCLLALVPAQLRRRDWAHAGFCIGLVALMALAAAGLPRHSA